MGETTRDKTGYTEIDDLIVEAADESSEYKDIDISSNVYEPVIVGLDGRRLVSHLEKPFSPENDREINVAGPDGNLLTIPLEDLQYLAFMNRPLQLNPENVSSFSEMIETFSRDSFKIRLPGKQNLNPGFFALSTNPADRYRYIFFTYNNVRIHYQLRRLGDIIVQNNLLSADILQSVLNKQYQLRKLRLGTIIAKRERLLQKDIEKILQQAGSKDEKRNIHAGDILIKAGLVKPQTVHHSLAIQKQLRRVKVGELLVQMGYLKEEQLYRVLAEKFRKRFVNLRETSVTDNAFSRLSKDMAERLKVAPVGLRDDRLIIATSFPDRPEISDILKERLPCPFELVVSPLDQIVEYLANLPG